IGAVGSGSLDTYVSYAGTSKFFARGAGAIVCTFSEFSATIATSAGTWRCARGASFEYAGALLAATVLDAAGRVSGLVVEDQSGYAPFAASASTQLDTTSAWLIHPSQPSLSRQIDNGPGGPRAS